MGLYTTSTFSIIISNGALWNLDLSCDVLFCIANYDDG